MSHKLGFSLDRPAPDPAPATDKANTPSPSLTTSAITNRFVAALDLNRPDAFHGIWISCQKRDLTYLFYFARSTVFLNPSDDLDQKVPKEAQYLNLLKAEWILQELKASSEVKSAAETNYLWLNLKQEVGLKIKEE